jgi:integrase/recombinase XerD
MLERYFVKPDTIDAIRNCWLGEPIEQYVTWLAERGYATRNIHARVPILKQFAQFAWAQGVRSFDALPTQVEPFVAHWMAERGRGRSAARTRDFCNEIRGPVEQLLSLILPEFVGRGRPPRTTNEPFVGQAPEFFTYLRKERGLRETSVAQYRHWLCRLEAYLARIKVEALSELSPAVLCGFVTDSTRLLGKNTITGLCCSLRVFLRYLHREGLVARDLAPAIEAPQKHRLSQVPRSITWDEVRRMLEAVDQRTAVGKRDYAILLLLVTYGLRAREVSALMLDDIDWKRERLLVPERKAGHCTAYPLSTIVGEALLVYLKEVRPETTERQVFFRVQAPCTPLNWNVVGNRATHYLRKAGIRVRRPGSHTLRHTCVQRLIDAEFPLKTIGDYVGHGSPSSTEVYSKVAIETLREVALGDGEALL